jgi:hypothetical protein
VSLTSEVAGALAGLVAPRAEPAAAAWFEGVFAEVDAAVGRERFLTVFAGAGRRLGRAAVEISDAESGRLTAAGLIPFPPGLGLDECGRGALLLKALQPLGEPDRLGLASEIYYRGEVRERQALLRVLAYLPRPERFRDLAIEACRTSVQDLFEAIACDNPYPAPHFPEPSFNQMVLKAVFTGVPLARVVGLGPRVSADLVRMAEDYAAERRAAGRPVPTDVDVILSATPRSA